MRWGCSKWLPWWLEKRRILRVQWGIENTDNQSRLAQGSRRFTLLDFEVTTSMMLMILHVQSVLSHWLTDLEKGGNNLKQHDTRICETNNHSTHKEHLGLGFMWACSQM